MAAEQLERGSANSIYSTSFEPIDSVDRTVIAVGIAWVCAKQ